MNYLQKLSSARGLLRCRLEEHRDAECLSLLDDSLKRCAIYDDVPYLVDHVDSQRNASALKLIEDASKQMDTERLRNALLTARRLPGLASACQAEAEACQAERRTWQAETLACEAERW